MVVEKLPPHDVDAEEAVLGSLLLDPEAISQIASFLYPNDFFREQNRWIFDSVLKLHDRGEALNQITLAHQLDLDGKLDSVGGVGYLAHLVAMVPTSVHIEYYGQIVARTALMRRLINAAGQIAAIGYEGDRDVDAALARSEEILFGLSQTRAGRDFVHIREVLDKYFEESGFVPKTDGETLTSVPTGFIDLDKLLGGLQRSDLLILAARPAMGKSSLALNIAYNAAVKHGARVAIFSLEMSKEQLVQRLLSSESGVDSQRLRLDTLSDLERRRVMQCTGVLAEAPIYFDDSPMLRAVEMRSKARRLHQQHGIDLIIIDYLQLLQGSGSGDNRVQEISEISRSMKALAREINVPVIALSQLSRAVETRSPHIPMLSDLRESGSIEQDADIVFFIYREEVYVSEQDWQRKNPAMPYPRGIADIIIAKHRNGPIGQVKLFFFSNTTKFGNMEPNRTPDM